MNLSRFERKHTHEMRPHCENNPLAHSLESHCTALRSVQIIVRLLLSLMIERIEKYRAGAIVAAFVNQTKRKPFKR